MEGRSGAMKQHNRACVLARALVAQVHFHAGHVHEDRQRRRQAGLQLRNREIRRPVYCYKNADEQHRRQCNAQNHDENGFHGFLPRLVIAALRKSLSANSAQLPPAETTCGAAGSRSSPQSWQPLMFTGPPTEATASSASLKSAI